jgi:hypothetical protein
MNRLESATNWSQNIKSSTPEVNPFLVSKMLEGDFYALSLFDLINKENQKLVITYSKIHKDDDLNIRFNKYGGAEDARAIISAENWLTSEDAANVMQNIHSNHSTQNDGREQLCNINESLGLVNEFIDCA